MSNWCCWLPDDEEDEDEDEEEEEEGKEGTVITCAQPRARVGKRAFA